MKYREYSHKNIFSRNIFMLQIISRNVFIFHKNYIPLFLHRSCSQKKLEIQKLKIT